MDESLKNAYHTRDSSVCRSKLVKYEYIESGNKMYKLMTDHIDVITYMSSNQMTHKVYDL